MELSDFERERLSNMKLRDETVEFIKDFLKSIGNNKPKKIIISIPQNKRKYNYSAVCSDGIHHSSELIQFEPFPANYLGVIKRAEVVGNYLWEEYKLNNIMDDKNLEKLNAKLELLVAP